MRFELAIRRSGEGLEVEVLHGTDAGEAKLPLPLAPVLKELRLPPPRWARDIGDDSVPAAEGAPDLRGIGSQLFESVIQRDIRDRFVSSRDAAKRENDHLRIGLHIEDDDLAAVPWELTFFDSRFVSQYHPVVRRVRGPAAAVRELEGHQLRILVCAPHPSDLPELDVAAERRALEEALARLVDEGFVHVAWEPTGTKEGLARMASQSWHVFHFIGHGDRGELAFVHPDTGVRDPAAADELPGLLPRDLQLVVLNACHGAAGSLHGRFAGCAQRLIADLVPDVIAMQHAIADTAAVRLAGDLYRLLADGYTLGAALAEARMRAGQGDHAWATPVHYGRGDDRVFMGSSARGIVDRDAPMKEFHRLIASSKGNALLIEGREGIGKTALYAELVAQVRRAAAPTVLAIDLAKKKRLELVLIEVMHAIAPFAELRKVQGALGRGDEPSADALAAWLDDKAGGTRDPLAALTRAIFDDLLELARGGAFVFVIDAFGEAARSTESWIGGPLVAGVLGTSGASLVLLGRKLSTLHAQILAQHAGRARDVHFTELGPIEEVDDWLVLTRQSGIPDEVASAILPRLIAKHVGMPSAIIAGIKALSQAYETMGIKDAAE
jgi:hypothetical protein